MKHLMHLQVQHRIPPQFHFLLNHFVHSYPLTTAWPSATQLQPKVHLLVHFQEYVFAHFYIDLEVNVCIIHSAGIPLYHYMLRLNKY